LLDYLKYFAIDYAMMLPPPFHAATDYFDAFFIAFSPLFRRDDFATLFAFALMPFLSNISSLILAMRHTPP